MTDTATRTLGRPAEHHPATNGSTPRVPPSNLAAEAALIGACLNRPDNYTAAANIVRPDDFYNPAHAHIWDAIAALHNNGRTADPVDVADHLNRNGLLEQAGGRSNIAALQAEAPTLNAPRYARLVAEHAAMRALIAIGHQVADIGWSQPTDLAAATNQARALLDDLVARQEAGRRRLHLIGDTLDDYLNLLEHRSDGEPPGLRTGWGELDELLGGLRAGQLIVVAGRPGMGKSIVGGQLARWAAEHQVPALVVSAEMGLEELLDRQMAAVTKLSSRNLRDGKIAPNDWARIGDGAARLAGTPLWILDDEAATVEAARAHAATILANHGADQPGPVPGLIVVDYLQLLQVSRPTGNRVTDIGQISGGLKRMARELGCPVVALAQLNRGLEARLDKRPTLPDLRESGSIENDADVVIGLYRDDYYNHDSKEAGVIEMIVLKQRSGPTGTARLAFLAEWQLIAELARGAR